VYYYGWWVLTSSGTMCEAPALQSAGSSSMSMAHRRALQGFSTSSNSWSGQTWLTGSPGPAADDASSRSSVMPQLAATALQDGTCVMPGGPLQLHHEASLPAIAPRGNYRMQLSASDANNGMELFCLDVWFKVAS
jgi:hypothetical protein